MEVGPGHVLARRLFRWRPLLWSVYLIILAVVAALLVLAPSLGLGEQRDFVLYQYFGFRRAFVLQLLLLPGVLAVLYEILAVGVKPTAGESQLLAVSKRAWADGRVIARGLFVQARAPMTRRERRNAIVLAVAFAIAFVAFFSKSLAWYKYFPEQRWVQSLVDYGIDWSTSAFVFGGNLLYGFGMQIPLQGMLLPIEGAAHLFPAEFRIAVAAVLLFLSNGLLIWWIGMAIGLKPTYRIVVAGSTALILTIPVGLSFVLWFLPPWFVTYNVAASIYWGETPILCLSAAFLFFLLGQQKSFTANLCAGIGFALGAAAPVLAYPYMAVYLIPVLALYCLGFVLTIENRKELGWKVATSAIVIALMVIARVPEFMLNLYSYTFAVYFNEFSPEAPATLGSASLAAVFLTYFNDLRGVISFMIAFAAVAIAACAAQGTLRRIAVAALTCEAGIIAVTTANLLVWQVPIRGDYADVAHAAVWCAFLVLSMIVLASLLDQRITEWGTSARSGYSSLMQSVIRRRRWAYGGFFVVTIAGYWLLQPQPAIPSYYPPARTPLTDLLGQELALAPGMPFRGRLMTVVPADLEGPSNPPVFYDTLKVFREGLGNDFWVDPLQANVPMLNEFGHYSSPLTFALARIFFGNEGDSYERTTIVLSHFELKIARLAGVKMVATDAPALPGGRLAYEAKVGDRKLRIFRLDDVNLGQYSPTRPRPVDSAADAVAAIKQADFDPMRDVVVERPIAVGLVPATGVVVTVDQGPAIIVRATSAEQSLLILPFEYSRCLTLDMMGGHAQLLPANLVQAGLLFGGNIAAKITYRFGLFRDAACRGDDLRRADDLKLKDALISQNRATLFRERHRLQ